MRSQPLLTARYVLLAIGSWLRCVSVCSLQVQRLVLVRSCIVFTQRFTARGSVNVLATYIC